MFQTVVTKYIQLLARKNAKQDRDYILLLLLNKLMMFDVQLETETNRFVLIRLFRPIISPNGITSICVEDSVVFQ